MTNVAAIVLPMSFVAASTNAASALPISNANIDAPAMVYQCGGSAPIVVDLGRIRTIDCVAMLGNDMAAADVWRVRTSTSNPAATDGFATDNLVAYTGFATENARIDSIVFFTPVQARYIRIDFTLPSLIVQRLVIGLSVRAQGVDFDAEKIYDDQSQITTGAGYTLVDEYPTYAGWKVSLAWISEDDYRQQWEPMYLAAGSKKGVLFVPDITRPDLYQSDAVFGRITSKPSGKNEFYNGWSTAPTIQALSPKLRS